MSKWLLQATDVSGSMADLIVSRRVGMSGPIRTGATASADEQCERSAGVIMFRRTGEQPREADLESLANDHLLFRRWVDRRRTRPAVRKEELLAQLHDFQQQVRIA